MGFSRDLGHCHDALRQIALPSIGTSPCARSSTYATGFHRRMPPVARVAFPTLFVMAPRLTSLSSRSTDTQHTSVWNTITSANFRPTHFDACSSGAAVMVRAIGFSTSPLANSSTPSTLPLLNHNLRTLRWPRRSHPVLLKPLHRPVSSMGGGATNANLSCADTAQIAVPINNPLSALGDAREDMTTSEDAPSHHTAGESSSCFAAAAYVQRTNMVTKVFTRN
jgi:hypothetical protein